MFIIEGEKLVNEALNPESNKSFRVQGIYGLQAWIDKNKEIIKPLGNIVNPISAKELAQISTLKTPNQVLAIVQATIQNTEQPGFLKKLIIALDNIQDPGNLGTIIRMADWFGIKNIILSPGCADPYSPKVVQATMGSIFRVVLHHQDLDSWLKSLPGDFPVYGAVLNGENLYKTHFSDKGVIIMGNESKGIQPDLQKYIRHPLTIPRGKTEGPGPDSLNVSMALGIILGEITRQFS